MVSYFLIDQFILNKIVGNERGYEYYDTSKVPTSAIIVTHACMSYNTKLFKIERSINYPSLTRAP